MPWTVFRAIGVNHLEVGNHQEMTRRYIEVLIDLMIFRFNQDSKCSQD